MVHQSFKRNKSVLKYYVLCFFWKLLILVSTCTYQGSSSYQKCINMSEMVKTRSKTVNWCLLERKQVWWPWHLCCHFICSQNIAYITEGSLPTFMVSLIHILFCIKLTLLWCFGHFKILWEFNTCATLCYFWICVK